MKKKRLFTVLLSSLLVAGSFASALSVSAANSKRISGVLQSPQKKYYWCGYAAMESLINNEWKLGNLYDSYDHNWSQTDVANYMRDNYGMDVYNGGDLSWYTGSKDTDDNQANYPAGRALTAITGFLYLAYGPGVIGTSISASEVECRVKSTTDKNHAVIACGFSGDSGMSHMPNYPIGLDDGHWVAVDGYYYGDVWIVDPAASSNALSYEWNNVSRYYRVSFEKFTAFIEYRGMLW